MTPPIFFYSHWSFTHYSQVTHNSNAIVRLYKLFSEVMVHKLKWFMGASLIKLERKKIVAQKIS